MFNFPKGPLQFSRRLFAGIDALARHRLFSIVVVFCLSFGGSWLFAIFRGIPVPYVQDEFSYLLAGDTFAHGRITNSAHSLWESFETFQELMKPSYMSKYPPGQGFFLAVGQVVFGHPIYGVWLSVGLMCAAICWMLYAWVSPRWALIGGLVAVIQFGIFTYWSQSYWGGAVAGFGGALVFGALPRILKTQRIRDALWLGLGCAVLANSRPLEGFLVALPVGCLVLPWKIKWKELILAKFIKKIILPLGVILLITVLGIGAYNKKITGDAGVFPYLLYCQTSRNVPIFIWQPDAGRVKFKQKIMEIQDQDSESFYNDKKTWNGFFENLWKDSIHLSKFFFGYLLAIPSLAILLLFFFYRQTTARFFGAMVVLLGACAVMTTDAKAHYFSPLTCLAVLLITFGMRSLAGLSLLNRRIGLVFVILLISFQLVSNLIFTPKPLLGMSMARVIKSSKINLPMAVSREELKDTLMQRGGKYLVIVIEPPWHNYSFEWVYNDADIDHAPIVWAKYIDEERNKRLLEYFKDRQVLSVVVNWDTPGFPHFDARQ